MLQRKAVKSPSLEIIKNEQDTAQHNFEPALHGGVGPSEVTSNLNYFKWKKKIYNYCCEKVENRFY